MLRCSRFFLAEATSTSSSTSTVSGRLIAVRKKSKWLDRRSKKVPHNGKEVFNFGEHPSCALCNVRFRYKQDYQAHKESELHMNRVRWVENKTWWKETGAPSFYQAQDDEWAWFQSNVLPGKAKELGCSIEEATKLFRRARMEESPTNHRFLQAPTVKQEVKEPKDQRWPSTPKW